MQQPEFSYCLSFLHAFKAMIVFSSCMHTCSTANTFHMLHSAAASVVQQQGGISQLALNLDVAVLMLIAYPLTVDL